MSYIRPYVIYDTAVTLKEKGYHQSCTHHYKRSLNGLSHSNTATFEIKHPFGKDYNNDLPTRVSAPLKSDVMDWLREKHKIIIVPFNDYTQHNNEDPIIEYYFVVRRLAMTNEEGIKTEKDQDFHKVLNNAIDSALKFV